jgi:hypothetical protein
MNRHGLTTIALSFWGMAALSLLAPLAVADSIVTVDFDNLPVGPVAVNALEPYGISSIISSGGGIPAAVYNCPSCGAVVEGSQNFLATSGGSYPSPTGIFSTTLIFDNPTSFFSFYKLGYSVSSVGVAGWDATAYDAGNNVVASVGVNLSGGLDYPPSPTPVQYSLSGANPITEVVFRSNYNYESTIGAVEVSDFQFTAPAPAPEPGTLFLVACGFAWIGLAANQRSIAVVMRSALGFGGAKVNPRRVEPDSSRLPFQPLQPAVACVITRYAAGDSILVGNELSDQRHGRAHLSEDTFIRRRNRQWLG